METSKAESEKVIKRAADEILRYKSENLRIKREKDILQLQLTKTKTELSNLKVTAQTAPNTPKVAQGFPEQPEAAPETAPASVPLPENTVEYVVQEGDSLWKIAEEQLDNGTRYNEIMDLNPGVDENTVLRQGMKLKLPAQ